MKPKFLIFPLLALALSHSAMGVGQFIWTGTANSTWTDPANWDTTSAPSISGNNHPIPGTHYKSNYLTVPNDSDFLNIKNNGDLTIVPTGTTPGFDAVYNPGAGVTTTFSGGRCFVIGTGNGPTATPPNTKGYAKLIVTSGTIVGIRGTNGGSEPYMANRADSTLLLNGGSVDLSQHINNFRLIQEGLSGITSTITIDSGSLSCRTMDLVFDEEADPSTVFGTGIINLNGGTLTMARITRTAASNPGQTSFTFNLNGGTLRPLISLTAPAILLDAVTDLTTIVKAGGAIINTTSPSAPTTAISSSIAEVLEHDPALGATLDGGLTKNGIGTLTLSGANTFTGPVTVNAGTSTTASRILLANNSAAGTGTITLADSYADIQLSVNRNIANPLVVSNTGMEKTVIFVNAGSAEYSGPITTNETDIGLFRVRSDASCFFTLSGKISGAGTLTKIQSGEIYLTNGANDYSGGTRIDAGKLNFLYGGLGTAGGINMNGGTLRWMPGNTEDISARLDMVAAKTATYETGGNNVTFGSAIGDSTNANLAKTGSGILTLTGTNTYTGTTTVNGGTLRVNGSLDPLSAVTVTTGDLGGSGTIGGPVTVAAAGNIAPGNSAGTLTMGGGLNVSAMAAGTGKLKFELGSNTATSDQIAVTGGTLTIGSGALGFSDFVFTNLGTLQGGTYTLITSTAINGGDSLDATNLTGAINAVYNGALSISGNNIVLTVTGGYSAWQAANGGTTQTIDQDHDNDGVSNGVEYFMFGNTSSTGFTSLPGVTSNSVTWVKAASGYAGNYITDFVVQTSDTLATGSWVTAPEGTNNGEVLISGSNVTYTFPTTGPKKFARLKVTGP